jgi:ligand-binding SRPBCC domain-containing protein
MNFNITSKDLPKKMYPGMLISYTVTPVLGIPMSWLTEITHVEDKKFFIDEQRYGPYSMWHHEHFIEPHKDGVLMRDIITYKLPLGILGQFAHWLFVKRQLNSIFKYRFHKMEEIFNNK